MKRLESIFIYITATLLIIFIMFFAYKIENINYKINTCIAEIKLHEAEISKIEKLEMDIEYLNNFVEEIEKNGLRD